MQILVTVWLIVGPICCLAGIVRPLIHRTHHNRKDNAS